VPQPGTAAARPPCSCSTPCGSARSGGGRSRHREAATCGASGPPMEAARGGHHRPAAPSAPAPRPATARGAPRAARGDTSVLLQGPSGAGGASSAHLNGGRAPAPS
jgi:hypothetical protein